MKPLCNRTEATMPDVKRSVWQKGLISSRLLHVVYCTFDDVTDSLGR